jgi:hypothetical protein
MLSCTASNPSHDFVLVYPLFCNDDRAGEIGRTFHFMTRHDLVLANDIRLGRIPHRYSRGVTGLHCRAAGIIGLFRSEP